MGKSTTKTGAAGRKAGGKPAGGAAVVRPGETSDVADARNGLHRACVSSAGLAEVEAIDRLGRELSGRIGAFRKAHTRACRCGFCTFARAYAPRLADDLLVTESNLDMNLSLVTSELPVRRS